MTWKMGMALAALSVVGLANADRAVAANPPIRTWGGEIFVRFIGYSALLRSELWFFGNTNPGPDQTPFAGDSRYTGYYLYVNEAPPPSAVPDRFGTLPVGSPAQNLGTIVFGGPFRENSPLSFGLYVQNLYKTGYSNNVIYNELGTRDRGVWFYTGLAAHNPDNRVHTQVTEVSPYHYFVGFEDSCRDPSGIQTGVLDCEETRLTADWDFNDEVLEVWSTPEPLTLGLVGSGLLGLGALGRHRRRRLLAS